MYRFAKATTEAELECIHNRDLTTQADQSLIYFVMSDEFDKKFGVDKSLGEIAVYSPKFEVDLSCAWVAQADDFDYIDSSLIRR